MPRSSSSSQLAARRRSAAVVRPRAHRYAVSDQKSQGRGLELLMMIGVNLAIASVAGLAIFRLQPYNASQQNKLRSLAIEVSVLEDRVNHLRQDFVNYFDPQQSRSNMRALSDRLESGQRKVILVDPPVASQTISGRQDRDPSADGASARNNSLE